ncbi:MAG: shikimate kinase [bacterium]
MTNIVLIGFMGAGKTAVGQRLADQLQMDYLDTDELIVKTEKKSINDIFSKRGEQYFRDLESTILTTLQDYDNFVISTGGGMVLRPENVKMLKEIGSLVLLWAEPEVVYERIKREAHRPLLKVADPLHEIKERLATREPIYRSAADLTVDTSRLTIDEGVERIKQWIEST